MPRSQTAPEATLLAGAERQITRRVKVANGQGTMIDVSAWVEKTTRDRDIDQPVSALTVEFRRDAGTTQSLSPFRTDSTLNRLDDGITFSPLIDAGRAITFELATTALGVAPVAGDYKLLFKGEIDDNDLSNSPLVVDCRDQGGLLVDRWVEVEAPYGSIPGVALETVDQQVLDATLGSGFVPLFVENSPSYVISPPYVQKKQSLMDASLALAQLPGFDTRYKWDDVTSAFRFTLYEPPRTKVVPDWTYTKGQYFEVSDFKVSRAGIKNVIYLSYLDATTKTRLSVVVSDSASITKYGRRPLFIVEGDLSPIDSAAKANTMLAPMLFDLKDPKAEASFNLPFNWAMEIHDLIRFAANGIHHDTAQDLAVVNIRDEITRKRARTIVRVRGKPAGAYAKWRDRSKATGSRPGEVGPEPSIRDFGGSTTRKVAQVLYTAIGGTAPLTYERRIDVDGVSTGSYSAPAALESSVTEWIYTQQYRATRVYLRVTDATGLQGNADPFFLKGWADSSEGAGDGAGQQEEERQRGGGGGHGTPGARYHGEPYYDATGSYPLLDPITRRIGVDLSGPTGITSTVFERGGNKGDQAIDGGYIVVGAGLDFTRAYTNKHLGNVPDDGTSDRRAATLDQKTGGDRGFGAIDSGGIAVTTAIDMSRAYTGKHLGNMPDDGTSDRKAVTANEKTGSGRAYTGLDSNAKLQTGVTAGATAGDGEAGIESARAATRKGARAAGSGAHGISGEESVRAGLGGYPVPGKEYNTFSQYDQSGSTLLFDAVTKELQAAAGLATGFRAKGDFAVKNAGGTTQFGTNRHNDEQSGKDAGATKSFGASFDSIPQMRALPQNVMTYRQASAAADQNLDVRATNVSVSTYDTRAKIVTGETSTARTNDFAATLNGTPVGAGVAIDDEGEAAYCNLANANATLTTYIAYFDLDLSAMAPANTLYVDLYKNDGVSSTAWTLVGSASYGAGGPDGGSISFNAALAVNWDTRIVISYETTPLSGEKAIVTCDRMDYNSITPGAEFDATAIVSAAVIFQAMEAP